MIRINLLPYREMRRADHRRRFQNMLALAIAASALLLAAGYALQSHALDKQLSRNQQLDSAIAELSVKLGKITELRQQRAALLARKDQAAQLQNGRAQAVRLFDDLIRFMPEGVYLKDFKQVGNTITLSGYAQSGARVSNYMGTLSESGLFINPVLIEVKAAALGNLRASEFSLTMALQTQSEQEAPKTGAPQ
ncbi:PilN domain-containing protein [Craterilacuibacter sp. RT1T]|uniref:PilN domain-containing protein n=1 Tax=Craterilacuibacter sp. RT1T TaxID=2942211 RepID=UPI0020BEA566|nr:PilN domain-containing protein [Craterilacuibacter sp. RT1T]MCL6264409.1 PilN domain-containing protein [Craterilacuibacter sp. RT1T]